MVSASRLKIENQLFLHTSPEPTKKKKTIPLMIAPKIIKYSEKIQEKKKACILEIAKHCGENLKIFESDAALCIHGFDSCTRGV